MVVVNFKKPQWTRDDIKVVNQIIDGHKRDAKLDVDENLLLAMAQAILCRLNATFSLPSYCKQSSHKDVLYSLRSGKAPLQHINVYAGYAFTGMSLAVLAGIFYSHSYSIALTGLCASVGFFLVKNMKRVVFEEVNITSDIIEKAVSEELVFTIHKIGRELSCDCSSGGDMKSLTVAVFETLVKYSWEDKLVIALLAFTVNYGEFRLLRNRHATDSLIQYLVHFKPSPDMISERESLIIILLKAVMALSQTINNLNSLDTQMISRMKPPFSEAVKQIPYAVYYAIKGIVACSSQGIGVTDMGHQYSITEARQNLTDLTENLKNITIQLTKLLGDCEKVIEEYKTNQAYHKLKLFIESIHTSNIEVFIELIPTKDELLPLYHGETKVCSNELKNTTVILFISYWNISDEEINDIVNRIGQSEGQYKVVWLPIEDESATSNKEKYYKEIDRKARILMNWYSLRSSVKLRSHVIKYIKEDWHFEEEPLLVVFDALGKVASPNAYHMAMIWGSAAYPFDIGTEITLWQGSIWNLEFLIEGVFIRSKEGQLEGEKLICLCGGDDLVWIANFISKAKKVIKGDGIILELIHVGTKRVENIEGNQIKYWDDLQEIRQFRARLNSIMHSIMQPHLSINKNIMNDVMTLLGAQGSGQGWTVLGQFGSGYVTAVNGNIMMESLDRIQTQTDITVGNFFPTLVNVIQEVTPEVRKHCYHIITHSTSGINGKDMYCVCCRGRMQKYTMYKCCVE